MPRNPYHSGPQTSHFDGLRFFNPDHPPTDRALREILRWKMKGRATPWTPAPNRPLAIPEARVPDLSVTIIGHATALIQIEGLNILTDPVWSERASPFSFAGPRRACPPGIAFAHLPPIDIVLLSHNHYDHMDLATLRALQARDRPLIVTPLGNDAIVRRAVPDARCQTGDWWDVVALAGGIEITVLPAQHWSARTGRDRRMALWSGFMVRTGSRLVYFAGDTAYGNGRIFREMRTRMGRPDMALIPIGAYEPRWFMKAQHADAREAVQIMEDLEAEQAVGIHWGVFRLTDEGREEPPAMLAASLEARGIAAARFPAGEPGASYGMGGVRPNLVLFTAE